MKNKKNYVYRLILNKQCTTLPKKKKKKKLLHCIITANDFNNEQ